MDNSDIDKKFSVLIEMKIRLSVALSKKQNLISKILLSNWVLCNAYSNVVHFIKAPVVGFKSFLVVQNSVEIWETNISLNWDIVLKNWFERFRPAFNENHARIREQIKVALRSILSRARRIFHLSTGYWHQTLNPQTYFMLTEKNPFILCISLRLYNC